MSVVIGYVSQIMTKYLSAYIVNARSWESYIKLSPQNVEQLSFWNDILQNLNDKDFTQSQKYSKIVYSDASASGFAGYLVNTTDGVSHGMWSYEESRNIPHGEKSLRCIESYCLSCTC